MSKRKSGEYIQYIKKNYPEIVVVDRLVAPIKRGSGSSPKHRLVMLMLTPAFSLQKSSNIRQKVKNKLKYDVKVLYTLNMTSLQCVYLNHSFISHQIQ